MPFNVDDPKHPHHHQEDQYDQEYILSTRGSFYIKYPNYHIFLETSGKISFNQDNPKNHDYHQECKDDQEHSPQIRGSVWRAILGD